MRPIDADVLKTDVRRYVLEGTDDCGEISAAVAERSFLRLIDKQPTIEAEPVVHGRWIDTKERMPELGERVLCTDGYCVFEQYRVELSCVYGIWDRGGIKSPLQDVTHWMPLPKPPDVEV